MQVAVEFRGFFRCQMAFSSAPGQKIHSLDATVFKVDGEQIFSHITAHTVFHLIEPREKGCIGIRVMTCELILTLPAVVRLRDREIVPLAYERLASRKSSMVSPCFKWSKSICTGTRGAGEAGRSAHAVAVDLYRSIHTT